MDLFYPIMDEQKKRIEILTKDYFPRKQFVSEDLEIFSALTTGYRRALLWSIKPFFLVSILMIIYLSLIIDSHRKFKSVIQ